MDNFQRASTAQQQPSSEAVSYNHFFNSLQSYTDESNYDFLLESDQFQQPDHPPNFPQQNNAAWTQPELPPSTDSRVPQYDSLHPQTSDQLRYGQSMFDSRPQSQPHYPSTSFPKPSPSPSPYDPYAYHHPMTFGNTPSFLQTPDFHQQLLQQQQARRSPLPPTSYSPDPTNQHSLQPYQMRPSMHPNLQGMNVGHFSGFPEPDSRQATNVIDPRFLNPSDFQKSQFDPIHASYQQPQPMFTQANSSTTAQQQRHPGPGTLQPMVVIPARNSVAQNGPVHHIKSSKAISEASANKESKAPKRKRSRPKEDGAGSSKKEGSGGSSDDDSDSDDLEVEEAPEPPPTIIARPRPDQVADQVAYDAVTAVWSPRNQAVSAAKVTEAVGIFGNLLKNLRDQWKTKNEAQKQAELANTTAVPSLKEQVTSLRKQAESALANAREFGHPTLLAQLGNNPFTLSALQSFAVDRINASDNDGAFVKAILKFMACFTSTDTEMLAKTKNDKILLRLPKRAGQEVQKLCQIILNNAAEATKRKAKIATPRSADSPVDPTGAKKVATSIKTDPVSGTKRPGEQGSLPAPKRALQASKPLALQRKEASAQAKASTPPTNGTNGTAAAKTKSVVPVPASKPTPSIFSTLSSASKKPGTSNAARAAAAKEQAVKASLQPKKESPPLSPSARASIIPQTAFSFADTMAALDKPKEVKVKKVDSRPQETEEERVKRVRKEARRKLRVSWKPDDELIQVQIFYHHPDEEIGHSSNMMRDVADVGGEGRMLKLHKDLTDEDEEEESHAEGDELETYSSPSVLDFDWGLDQTGKREGSDNTIPRGGTAPVESLESKAQALREETTLMVTYTLPSDAPPTPREPPPAEDEDDYSPPTSFGEPGDQIRSREAQYYASLTSRRPPSQAGQPNLAALLSNFQPQQQSPHNQSQFANLEAIFKQQAQPQPTVQPQGQQPPANLLALVQHFQQSQQQQQTQPPQQNFFQSSQPTATAQPSVNLAEMLASLKQPQGQPPQPPTTPGRTSSFESPNPNPFPGRQVPNFKTVVCKFWKEGKCRKGDDCTYRHDEG